MLSVAKLGAGQEGYYLDSVAQGVEDYYLGHGETPGRWMGSASALLGLDGEVDAQDLRAVLEGRSPVDGTRLIQARKDRVPGFDLTFSAPKSVSVLFGLGDPDTVRAVRAAHDRSVDAALGWLEREACVSRRGIDGVEQIPGDGFAAAGFVHRTSRAGDPQLHTHVLVANLTRCDDGRWRTLHGGPVFWQARTAGYLYKAQLRHELTARLGVVWGPVHKGAAEIIGVPAELCALFSTRRREIQDELDARGEHSSRAARVAALETRQAKDYGVDIGALRDHWHDQALEAGHVPTTITAIGQTVPVPITTANEQEAMDVLLGAYGLTEQATTFDRRAVLRGWCEQLPAGAPITTIEELADRTLADGRVIALQDRAPYPKYSTDELVALEQRLVDTALNAIDTSAGVVAEPHLRMALDARPELSPEQVAAVAAITTSGNGLDVIVAAAGTGKTFSLDAAADAWRHSGYHVIGAALAATAAAQLQTQTGIGSDTIALRTLQLANGTLRLDRRTVVVIDEAAMASTRGLVLLLDAAHDAGAKVVMVGDPHQLDAIEAGGLLNGLASRLPAIALTENRRQQHAWEREALAHLRAGRIADAFDGYNAHDRVLVADTAIDVRNHMAADWHAATLAGDHVLMLAERRYDVDDLNERARRHLTRNGTLTGPALEVDDLTFQAGDRVLCLRNDRRIGVRNGTIGTVTDLDAENRSIAIRTDDGTTHELPSRYLDAGHVRYGYALTIHKSQGITADRCLVLASDTLDRQAGYTALSRGRTDNRIYLVAQPAADPEAHHPERDTPDPTEQLAAALRPDRRERLAIDHHIDTNPLREDLELLYQSRCRLDNNRLTLPDRKADIRALERERHDQTNTAETAQRFLDAKRPVLHRREHNIARLAAERARDQATTAIHRIDQALEQARHDQTARETHNRNSLDEIRLIDFAIRDRLDKLVETIAQQPPDYLQRLGPRPTDPSDRHHWNNIVRDIEAYRIEHDITDPRQPLGPSPTTFAALHTWTHLAEQYATTAAELDPTRTQYRGRSLDRSIGIEL